MRGPPPGPSAGEVGPPLLGLDGNDEIELTNTSLAKVITKGGQECLGQPGLGMLGVIANLAGCD